MKDIESIPSSRENEYKDGNCKVLLRLSYSNKDSSALYLVKKVILIHIFAIASLCLIQESVDNMRVHQAELPMVKCLR